MTEAQVMTDYIHESIQWARTYAKSLPLLGGKHAKRTHLHAKAAAKGSSRRRLMAEGGEGGEGAAQGMQALHPHYQRHMLGR
jgi:hypothetical protein